MKKLCAIFCCLWAITSIGNAEERLLVAVTTSTENSGLLNYLRPKIQADLGFTPEFVVSGSGQALRLGQNHDVDLVWVHDPKAEKQFMASQHGLRYESVMYNRFFLVGPKQDPAKAADAVGILDALQRIQHSNSLFVSRGDDSGTHRREQNLWRMMDRQHPILSRQPLDWYRELGSGMGATLNAATAMAAYTLADEATWLKHGNNSLFAVMIMQDPLLRNPYGIIVVAGTKRIDATRKAQLFSDWLISSQGQQAISAYRIDGKQGFFPLNPAN